MVTAWLAQLGMAGQSVATTPQTRPRCCPSTRYATAEGVTVTAPSRTRLPRLNHVGADAGARRAAILRGGTWHDEILMSRLDTNDPQPHPTRCTKTPPSVTLAQAKPPDEQTFQNRRRAQRSNMPALAGHEDPTGRGKPTCLVVGTGLPRDGL